MSTFQTKSWAKTPSNLKEAKYFAPLHHVPKLKLTLCLTGVSTCWSHLICFVQCFHLFLFDCVKCATVRIFQIGWSWCVVVQKLLLCNHWKRTQCLFTIKVVMDFSNFVVRWKLWCRLLWSSAILEARTTRCYRLWVKICQMVSHVYKIFHFTLKQVVQILHFNFTETKVKTLVFNTGGCLMCHSALMFVECTLQKPTRCCPSSTMQVTMMMDIYFIFNKINLWTLKNELKFSFFALTFIKKKNSNSQIWKLCETKVNRTD